jgi:hypothetical protein
MKLVYIAGPFRGKNAWEVENNIREAEGVGFAVANLGMIPVIPHTMYRFFDGTLDDKFWLDATLELMHRCDALLLSTGWRKSEGANKESELFNGPQFENIISLKQWSLEST